MARYIFILLALAVSLLAVRAEAINQVEVVPAPGNAGVFYLNGIDFVNVDGIEVELVYDTTALANPRITQGPELVSTYYYPNPKFTARSVKIVASTISKIKSGHLATISFDLIGSSTGSMAVARRIISDSTGTAAPSTSASGASIVTPTGTNTNLTDPRDDTVNTPRAQDSSALSTSISGGGISIGAVTLPQDQMATTERKPEYQPLVTDLRKDMTIPAASSESSKAGLEKSSSDDRKVEQKLVSYKSVVQHFKEFKGDRTSNALIALFAEAAIPEFTQEPLVAISDGLTSVKLTLILKPSRDEIPKFILQGANVKQLRGEGEEVKWTIEALPKKGVSEAKLTVIDGSMLMEFPLTVAPPAAVALNKGVKISEADFTAYLSKPAKYDLNSDGKFDYMDDFIYTANYIVAMKIKPEKIKPVEKDKKTPLKPEQKAEPAGDNLPTEKDRKEGNEVKRGKAPHAK